MKFTPPVLDLGAYPITDWFNDNAIRSLLNAVTVWLDQCFAQRRDSAFWVRHVNELLALIQKQENVWIEHRKQLENIYDYRTHHGYSDVPMLGNFLRSHPETFMRPKPDTMKPYTALQESMAMDKTPAPTVSPGLYQGWKGHLVLVTGVRKDSESTEGRVDYIELTNADGTVVPNPEPWSRLVSDWNKPVDKNGYKGPRFIPLTEGTLRHQDPRKTSDDVSALTEGSQNKGGQMAYPSQVTERPDPPKAFTPSGHHLFVKRLLNPG